MSESSVLGGFERFSKRKDVEKALADIADTTAGLNESLSYATPDYDSLVVFSHVSGEDAALPLSTTDAYDALRHRHFFRESTIKNRRVVLRGTSLGAALADPRAAGFAGSQINTESPQMVYTEQLEYDGAVVGAIQHSFTPVEEDGYIEHLPDEHEMTGLSKLHRQEIAKTAALVALLQSFGKELGPLGTSLEYDDPIAPTAFIVRWDIEGSTQHAHGRNMQALDAFQNQAHLFLRRLTNDYQTRYQQHQYGIEQVYSDQGDGAYLVLPLPKSHNPYETQVLKDYHKYSAVPFMQQVKTGLEAIGTHYLADLAPRVQVSGDFGYVEENGFGRLKSTTMFKLASQKKK